MCSFPEENGDIRSNPCCIKRNSLSTTPDPLPQDALLRWVPCLPCSQQKVDFLDGNLNLLKLMDSMPSMINLSREG